MDYQINETSKRFIDVAAQITEKIRTNELPIGTKLPIESELAKQYSVSRSTIREAMKYLSAEGLVSVQQGRGTFVARTTCYRDDPLGIDVLDANERLQQVLEARLVLEPQITLVAVQKATDEDVKKLGVLFEQFQVQKVNNQEAMELDIQFHKAVAECTHNEILIRLVPMICEAVQRTQALLSDKTLGLQRAQESHSKIYQAIKTRDAIGARYVMEQHIRETMQLVHGSDI